MISRTSRPRGNALSSRSASAARLAALCLAAAACCATPARADEYRYVFAVEGEGDAAERTVRSENSGAAARGPSAVWNSIDARSVRQDPDGGGALDATVAPTAEVAFAPGSHLLRPAARVIPAGRRGGSSAGSRLSMAQFMNNTGMSLKPKVELATNNTGEKPPAPEGGGKKDGDGGGEEDRFWEATPTGKSLQELYREILGRDIDRSGFETYSGLVDKEGKSLEEIRKVLLESDEYRERILKLPPKAKEGETPATDPVAPEGAAGPKADPPAEAPPAN